MPVGTGVIRGERFEQLMWSKRAFVFHGLAFADEVAHVEPLHLVVAGVVEFLQDGPCADPGLSPLGIVVEVDAAKAGGCDID